MYKLFLDESGDHNLEVIEFFLKNTKGCGNTPPFLLVRERPAQILFLL